jgi:acyl-CoA dehydrogenase
MSRVEANPYVERARRLSSGLSEFARETDATKAFPKRSVDLIRDAALLGWFIREEDGGVSGSIADFCRITAHLGEGCTSTALIYAMHCQQAALLRRHGGDALRPQARSVAEGALMASVTTEREKGGDLLTVQTPLVWTDSEVLVERDAPVVSYGRHADLLLVTMRRSAQHPPTEVALVLLDPREAGIDGNGAWDAMGMRGTCSAGLRISQRVPSNRVFPEPFHGMALTTMIPIGHLGWASAWMGAARGAMRRLLTELRLQRRGLTSELFLHRVGELRLALDLVEALIADVARDVDLAWSGDTRERFKDAALNIRVNSVKVAAARLTFQVVNSLVEMAGLAHGYREGSMTGLERVFRDLRSATLMFHDDRLLQANGRLTLIDTLTGGELSLTGSRD